MAGKYDDILSAIRPPSNGVPVVPQGKGKYDDILSSINAGQPERKSKSYAEELEPGIYGETNPTGQKILENLAIAAGGYGLGALGATGIVKAARSNLGKALLNSPKSLKPQYTAQDLAVRIKRTVPETGARAVFPDPYIAPSGLSKPRYANVKSLQPEIVNAKGKIISPKPPSSIEAVDSAPASFSRPRPTIPAEPLPTTIPEKIPEKFAGFKKFADSRIDKFGDKLTPQELVNYKVHLETKMNDGSIPKFNDRGKITTAYQQASELNKKISDTFKTVMDKRLKGANLPEGVLKSRTELDRLNYMSNRIREIPGKVYSGAKKAAKVGAVLGGLGYGAKLLSD